MLLPLDSKDVLFSIVIVSSKQIFANDYPKDFARLLLLEYIEQAVDEAVKICFVFELTTFILLDVEVWRASEHAVKVISWNIASSVVAASYGVAYAKLLQHAVNIQLCLL